MYVAKDVISGMSKQGKGIKLYVESEYAPLKACWVGNPSAVYGVPGAAARPGSLR